MDQQREGRMNYRAMFSATAAATALLVATPLWAADVVRVTSGTIGDWDVSVSEFGKRAGIFAGKGIDLQISYSDGSAATLQAVISGSTDIGVGIGTSGFLAAAMKGAPIKIISSQYTGAPDLMWYVRADSPIKSLKDVKEGTTLSYSTNGSSSHITLLALMGYAGVQGKPVAGGNEAANLTQVMSGQIDVGWNTDGGLTFGDARDKVRVIASGADLPHFRDLTVRTLVTSTDNLTKRRDLITRYLQAYQATIDWMYGPGEKQALQWYADQKKVSLAEATRVRDAIYPRTGMRLGPLRGVELSIKQGVEAKRIPAAITLDEFGKYVDYVWQPTQ
jgi:NitT/TauT family transport system substrate-binding protein